MNILFFQICSNQFFFHLQLNKFFFSSAKSKIIPQTKYFTGFPRKIITLRNFLTKSIDPCTVFPFKCIITLLHWNIMEKLYITMTVQKERTFLLPSAFPDVDPFHSKKTQKATLPGGTNWHYNHTLSGILGLGMERLHFGIFFQWLRYDTKWNSLGLLYEWKKPLHNQIHWNMSLYVSLLSGSDVFMKYCLYNELIPVTFCKFIMFCINFYSFRVYDIWTVST